MLTRDQILGVDDLPRRKVEVPEWSGAVYVRALNGLERDKFERMTRDDSISRATLAAFCVVDEKGERLFSDADATKLAQKNGAALERIVLAAFDFNGYTDSAVESAKND